MRHGLVAGLTVAAALSGTAPASASTAGALSPLPGTGPCIGESPCTGGRGAVASTRGLAVSADGRNVYATTGAGVAVFHRDASTGELTMLPGESGCLGFPEGSGGGRRGSASPEPVGPCGSARGLGYGGAGGLSVSPDGRNVYVTSQVLGDYDVVGTLVVFARDPGSGALTQLPGTAGCLIGPFADGSNPGCRAVDFLAGGSLVFSPDGAQVYASWSSSDSGASYGNGIHVYTRDGSGALSRMPGPGGCITRDLSSGCTTAGNGFDAADLEVAPGGGLLYAGGETLTTLRRDPSGALAPTGSCLSRTEDACSPFRALGGASVMDISPDGRHLYATGATSRRVVMAAIGLGPEGGLQQLPGDDGCLTDDAEGGGCTVHPAADDLNNPLVSADGDNVYAKIQGGIISLERRADGSIATLDGPAGCVNTEKDECTQVLMADAEALAASPDGKHVYSGGTHGVAAWERVPGVKFPGAGAAPASLVAQVRGATAKLPVECRADGRCKGRVRLLATGGAGGARAAARATVLGTGSYSIAKGRKVPVKVKLTKRGRSLVKRRSKVKVLAETTARVSGRTLTTRAVVTLRR